MCQTPTGQLVSAGNFLVALRADLMDRETKTLAFVDQLHSIRLAYLYNVSYSTRSQYNIAPRVQKKSNSGPAAIQAEAEAQVSRQYVRPPECSGR
jgi:hypothetical protein